MLQSEGEQIPQVCDNNDDYADAVCHLCNRYLMLGACTYMYVPNYMALCRFRHFNKSLREGKLVVVQCAITTQSICPSVLAIFVFHKLSQMDSGP